MIAGVTAAVVATALGAGAAQPAPVQTTVRRLVLITAGAKIVRN